MSGGKIVTAVVTADNHLNRYYDRMSPQRLEVRRRHLRRGFHQAVEYALEHRVDLFLQAGDLFDTPDPRNLDREFVARELGLLRAASIRVCGVGGNHDTPKQRTDQGGALPRGIYSELGALHLFEGDGLPTETVDVDGLRVAIGALPWSPLVGSGRDPLDGVDWAPEADLGIFLFQHSIEHRRRRQAAVEQRVLQSLNMLRAAALGELKQREVAEDRLEMQADDVAVAFERRLAVAALRSWAKRRASCKRRPGRRRRSSGGAAP